MPSEDQDILAKISQLAGQINRHKNEKQHQAESSPARADATIQAPHYCRTKRYLSMNNTLNADELEDHTQINTAWRGARTGFSGRGRGYPRGGRAAQVHRNRSLVLNGAVTPSLSETGNAKSLDAVSDSSSTVHTSAPAWVTKTDRHLQLINPAIYEKQSMQRAKAIEETRKLKLRQRDERERQKISNHLQKSLNSAESAIPSSYEIVVHGIRFLVAKNGSKLLRIAGDDNATTSTPKTATVGGVMFYRSKNGNLYRSGIVKAHRRRGMIKKIDEPCKAFSTTGTCLKGPKCRFVHDPEKVAICKDFLQKGTCPAGEACDLSHELTPERTPACLHFAKGKCSNPNCRYSHVRVSASAFVCRPFGIYGYCDKGLACTDRHVHECPDFSNTGVCNTKGCKLLHRHKASIIRKNTSKGEQPGEAESSDLSSDEEPNEINSDDVDSDDLDEEYFGEEDGEKDQDVPLQQDFVHLV